MACPDASWKKRAAKSFPVPDSAVGILGVVPSRGMLKGLLRLLFLTMVSRQLLIALFRSVDFRKALLTSGEPRLSLATFVAFERALALCATSLAASLSLFAPVDRIRVYRLYVSISFRASWGYVSTKLLSDPAIPLSGKTLENWSHA